MDEIRVQALRQACIAMCGASYDEIVRAAESFYGFLRGEGEPLETATPPPIPQVSATDLSQADQTPPYHIDTDDTPTRLVRSA